MEQDTGTGLEFGDLEKGLVFRPSVAKGLSHIYVARYLKWSLVVCSKSYSWTIFERKGTKRLWEGIAVSYEKAISQVQRKLKSEIIKEYGELI